MNHTAPTEIYTLSLHDALPIYTPTSTEASGRKPAIRRVPMTALFQWTTANPFRALDRKSTRLNSSHLVISYAVFCLKKKKKKNTHNKPTHNNIHLILSIHRHHP